MLDSNEIRFEKRGRAGVITLAKQEALNAVNDRMLSGVSHHLDEWEYDASIECVIIKATPGRAFSAGGDIRHLYDCGVVGDYDFDFFAREYALNARIHAYPKPYIALIDGIAMGGGVGVSFHGSHRVAGDKIAFSMPEVGIGFFPDVGGSYLLSRTPGHLGVYLGLTGSRLKQQDCFASGLATHACRSEDLAALEDELCRSDAVDDTLDAFCLEPRTGANHEQLPWIDKVFNAPSVEAIVDRLNKQRLGEGDEAQWASKTLEGLLSKSPLSLKVAFEQIKRGKDLSMADCMRMEYRILRRILPRTDFYEGIRAAIIDKDAKPSWDPASLDDVDDLTVGSFFDDLGEHELVLS